MLTENQLFHVKRQAGLRLILELGLSDFPPEFSHWDDVTEEISRIVHEEMMNYLMYRWPKGQVFYSDAILNQEWELVRTLCEDLRTVARLYFTGEIKLEVRVK